MSDNSILAVGSMAFDSIQTPAGKADRVLGGSLNYFSLGASLFAPVSIVGVVGEDFPKDHLSFLKTKGINTDGIEVNSGRTFFWKGEYDKHLDEAKTLTTELNVFETFNPQLQPHHRRAPYVFLANIDPDLQLKVLSQNQAHVLAIMDTMNFWITGPKLNSLKEVLKRVDILSINEGEAYLLSGKSQLREAADSIMRMGPSVLVVKRGETGAVLFLGDEAFTFPAHLVDRVVDPTGAGDTFAAGFVGYLAKNEIHRDLRLKNPELWKVHLKRAMSFGCVMASFTVEDFSISRLLTVDDKALDQRHRAFLRMASLAV